MDHGIQIPRVVEYFQLSVQSLDSDLVINEQYSAVITALNANGEGNYKLNMTVVFGMCCTLN